MLSDHLFSPFTLRSLTLKNRIVVSPMCQYSCENGLANEWHFVHLGSRAVGGASVVFTEATAVSAAGRISPQDLGLWSDDHITPLLTITQFIQKQGAFAGIQLAHAGRKASTQRPWDGNGNVSPEAGGWQPVAPSAIPFSPEALVPAALSVEEINQIVEDFAQATHRALLAGFNIIEIHSAHGYLLHEFLSPLSNQRQDVYGQDFAQGSKLLLDVVDRLRGIVPEGFPLFVRLSCTDWVESGWDIEACIALCRVLKSHGVDLIDASSGGNVPTAPVFVGAGYQTIFAQRIRQEAGIATGAVGLITAPAQADHIIRTQQADLVFLGREMLRDPYWPLTAAKALGYPMAWPSAYQRAAPVTRKL